MPIIDGASIWLRPAIIAIIGSIAVVVIVIVARPLGRAERHGELGEQRPICVERPLRVGARSRQLERRARYVETGDVTHVHLCDIGETDVRDADGGVDVGLARPAGRRQRRELARCVPVQRALTRECLREISEHRHPGERVHAAPVAAAGVTPSSPESLSCRHGDRPRARCYGDLDRAAVGCGQYRARVTRIWVSDADSALGSRVVARVGALPQFEWSDVRNCEIAVYTGGSDPDARSRRRESITAGATAIFDQIGDVRHFVIVSSALVYGAWANNPVPLTEDAVLRPDVEFAYARQLAQSSSWPTRGAPHSRPHRHRPPTVIAMAANGTSGLARGARCGHGAALRRGGSARAVPPPRRPRERGHAGRRARARRRVQRRSDGFIPADSVRALAGARRGSSSPTASPRSSEAFAGGSNVARSRRAAQLHALTVARRERPSRAQGWRPTSRTSRRT
jgi:hypothetical protein